MSFPKISLTLFKIKHFFKIKKYNCNSSRVIINIFKYVLK